jgi:hypothetical protein
MYILTFTIYYKIFVIGILFRNKELLLLLKETTSRKSIQNPCIDFRFI